MDTAEFAVQNCSASCKVFDYVVFEVSAFGGFRGLRDGCGLDVAPRYADHIVRELQRD